MPGQSQMKAGDWGGPWLTLRLELRFNKTGALVEALMMFHDRPLTQKN